MRNKFIFAGLVLLPLLAVAGVNPQPDISDARTYIYGGIATVLAVFVAIFAVKAAILVADWVTVVIDQRQNDRDFNEEQDERDEEAERYRH